MRHRSIEVSVHGKTLNDFKFIVSLLGKNTSVVDRTCFQRLQTYVSEHSKHYPLTIGDKYEDEDRSQMAEYLLRKHFVDFKSSHNMPLKIEYFYIPWDLPSNESVKNMS